ncbi:MAG: DUF2288 domain-containing protein [Gammaproteobacteria bacterium]|nr:DUF2288 domain-containing protein [Gammaproteobacteria bacterium]
MSEIDRGKINLETARISWPELQRQFASGHLIYVAKDMDLVEVAWECAQDNAALLRDWMSAGNVARVSDDQARQWQQDNTWFWAVVVKPWVLIQPLPENT